MDKEKFAYIFDSFIFCISLFGMVFGLYVVVFNPPMDEISISKTQLLGLLIMVYSTRLLRFRKRD